MIDLGLSVASTRLERERVPVFSQHEHFDNISLVGKLPSRRVDSFVPLVDVFHVVRNEVCVLPILDSGYSASFRIAIRQ
jgi:hypothetical protein